MIAAIIVMNSHGKVHGGTVLIDSAIALVVLALIFYCVWRKK